MANPTHLTPEQLAAVDIKAGWPLPQVARIVKIQEDQSGGNANEVGWNWHGQTVYDTIGTVEAPKPWSSYDIGISQIDIVHDPNATVDPTTGDYSYDPGYIAQMENPVANAQEALQLYKGSGWSPWSG